MKQVVLKTYELVPEAYRQKFRNTRKQTNQIHVEFARVQEQILDRWLSSKNVNQEFNQLKQIVLIEQFKTCIHAEIKAHLDERDIDNLQDAATTADDYALTHKLSSISTSGPNKSSQNYRNNSNRPNQSKSPNSQSTKDNTQSDPSGQGNKDPSSTKPKSGDGFKSSVTCLYWKLPGHFKSDCRKLMRLQQQQDSTPTGCAVSIKPQVTFHKVRSEKIREDFEPFVLEGLVSLDGDNVNPTPVKIMRDTCCAQFMISEGSLHFSTKSATGESVLIQGIGMNIVNVSLHKLKLKTDLVSGTVLVGVRPELPVKGVSLLLGSDLAGGKVLPEPIVSNSPCTEVVPEEDKDILLPVQSQGLWLGKPCVKLVRIINDGVPSFGLEDSFVTKLDVMGHLPTLGRQSPQNRVLHLTMCSVVMVM